MGNDIIELVRDPLLHLFVRDTRNLYRQVVVDANLASVDFITLLDLDIGTVTREIPIRWYNGFRFSARNRSLWACGSLISCFDLLGDTSIIYQSSRS